MIEEQKLKELTLKAAQTCLEPNLNPGIELLRWLKFMTLYNVLDPNPSEIKGTPIEELLLKKDINV